MNYALFAGLLSLALFLGMLLLLELGRAPLLLTWRGTLKVLMPGTRPLKPLCWDFWGCSRLHHLWRG